MPVGEVTIFGSLIPRDHLEPVTFPTKEECLGTKAFAQAAVQVGRHPVGVLLRSVPESFHKRRILEQVADARNSSRRRSNSGLLRLRWVPHAIRQAPPAHRCGRQFPRGGAHRQSPRSQALQSPIPSSGPSFRLTHAGQAEHARTRPNGVPGSSCQDSSQDHPSMFGGVARVGPDTPRNAGPIRAVAVHDRPAAGCG